MKRIILLSFVSMLLSVGTTMAEGISSARELVAFATAANAGEDITPWADREGVISLTADIDMAKVKDFVPIAVFDGIFDGGCHTISNWKTTAGLFHIVSEKAVSTEPYDRRLVFDEMYGQRRGGVLRRIHR